MSYSKDEHDKTESFFPTLQKFLIQAEAGNDMKVKEYPKEFNGLLIKVSFGYKSFARIPWISFLAEEQTTNNGIYPIFLYFKSQNLLILAYGVSENKYSSSGWNLPTDVTTIRNYFLDNGYGTPERYGGGFVYKVYSPISEIEQSSIDKDLNEIIRIYKRQMNMSEPPVFRERPAIEKVTFLLSRTNEIEVTGLLFSNDLIHRYALSLLTKPFVILSGLTGSGKTRLALTFARWLSGNTNQVKVVSVGADWNNREYLLGYPNALITGTYIKPENGVLDFLLLAAANPARPYFLILDEMNLSYVERYFADFLSAMESGEAINLHPDTEEWKACDVPAQIKLPSNLYITGTINVDETTYMFSPKVLDRANVIEFRIHSEDMDNYLTHCKPLVPEAADHKGADMERNFVTISQSNQFDTDQEISRILLAFFNQLKSVGAEFGYRTAGEIYRFVTLARQLNTGWDNNHLVDIAVMQKMLPRLHGSRKKMEPVLRAMWKLCMNVADDKVMIESDETAIDNRFRYPLSAEKIRKMFRNARDNGFTSYAEA